MSKRRAITPISLAAGPTSPAVIPAKALGAKPEIAWVDPRTLQVEEAYQRELSRNSMTLIRRIVAGWDWAHVKPPICARGADGRLCIIDGQHTAIAAVSHGGVAKIPVMIVAKPLVEGRAAAFLAHNRDRLFLTPMAIYHAALAAGDPAARAVDAVAKKAGARIVKMQKARWEPGETIAIGAIKLALAQHGAGGAALALKLLVDAGRGPLVEGEIKAAAALLHDLARPVPCQALLKIVSSETRETWQRLSLGIAAERKQRAWQALAGLWRAQAEGTTESLRGRASVARAAGEGAGSRRSEASPVSPSSGLGVAPATTSAAAQPIAPPRKANGVKLVRNEKVEREVLDAIERGPAAGVDLGTLRQKTAWPENNIRNALRALAHEKRVVARGQRYALAGVEG